MERVFIEKEQVDIMDNDIYKGEVRYHNSLAMVGICYALDNGIFKTYSDTGNSSWSNPFFRISKSAIATIPQYETIRNYFNNRYFDDYSIEYIKGVNSPKNTVYEFIRFIENLDKEIKSTLSNQVKGVLLHLVSEIDRNVRHHSGCKDLEAKNMYFVFQFFKNKRTFNITILDEGQGFKSSFVRRGKKYEGIHHALSRGVTAGSNFDYTDDEGSKNSGYGLYILSELVRLTAGTLYINSVSSGEKSEIYKSGIFEYKHDINIKEFENICMSHMNTGTAIFFELQVDKLLSDSVTNFISSLNTSEASSHSKNFYYPDTRYEIAKTILSELKAEEEVIQSYIDLGLEKCKDYVESNFSTTEKFSIEYVGKTIEKGNRKINVPNFGYDYFVNCYLHYTFECGDDVGLLNVNFNGYLSYKYYEDEIICKIQSIILNPIN